MVMLDLGHKGHGDGNMCWYSLAHCPPLYFLRRKLKIYLQIIIAIGVCIFLLPFLSGMLYWPCWICSKSRGNQKKFGKEHSWETMYLLFMTWRLFLWNFCLLVTNGQVETLRNPPDISHLYSSIVGLADLASLLLKLKRIGKMPPYLAKKKSTFGLHFF